MAADADNVRVALTGAVYVAPSGTVLPTTVATALDPAFVDLGFVSTDGVTEAYNDETSEIRAWQGGQVVRRRISSSETTLAFTLIETNNNVLELFHKGSIVESDGATGYKMAVRTPNADKRAVVVDVVDGNDTIRIVAPSAEVTERTEVVYGEEQIGYGVTLTCYPTADGAYNDVTVIKYSGSAGWNL